MQPTVFKFRASYVPPGGYGMTDGRVLTREEVNHAVRAFAQRRGYYARTVRTITALFRQAMQEYAERTTAKVA